MNHTRTIYVKHDELPEDIQAKFAGIVEQMRAHLPGQIVLSDARMDRSFFYLTLGVNYPSSRGNLVQETERTEAFVTGYLTGHLEAAGVTLR